MNKTISMGRLTDEPKISSTQSGKTKAEFSMALPRAKEGADFPRFVAWEKTEGHIQTGSYEGKNGKVYTTDIIVDRMEFCDSKPKDGTEGQPNENPDDGWMNVPEGIDAEEMPFRRKPSDLVVWSNIGLTFEEKRLKTRYMIIYSRFEKHKRIVDSLRNMLYTSLVHMCY